MQDHFTRIAVYKTLDDAQRTVYDLLQAGFRDENVSLVHRDATGEYARVFQAEAAPDEEEDETAAGAGLGGLAGAIGGLLIGVGVLTIPGLGPVLAAGPIVSALAGGAAGAAGGAAVGALVESLEDEGFDEEEAEAHAEALRRGGALVIVTTTHDANQLEKILARRAVDMEATVEHWRERGWEGYDPTLEAPADIDPDMEFYNR